MSNLPPAPGHDRLTGEPARPDCIAAGPPGPRTTARSASPDDDKRWPRRGRRDAGDGPYLFKCRHPNVNLKNGDQMNRFADLKDKVLPLLRPYVKRISVFGSFARGEETPESDIDLLVELKPPENRPRLGLEWFGLEEELSRVLGREVELIAEGSLSPYLRPYAEKDLVLLYEER